MTASVLLPEVLDAVRLSALHQLQILDTSPESEFEDLAMVAGALCETPIALVSLVEHERQWFKAAVGVDLRETPITMSVCAHGLNAADPLIIPDLAIDPRTRDNPLMLGDIPARFYAGAPLITPEGHVVGMLCTIDTKPRPDGLSERQVRGLRALAHQVMLQMLMRQSMRQSEEVIVEQTLVGKELVARAQTLRESGDRLRAAQEAGRVGTFEVDIATDVTRVTPEMCTLFGLPVRETYPLDTFTSLVVPEDRHKSSTMEARQSGSAATDIEIRIRRADDGQLRWINRRSSFVYSDTGVPERMLGTVLDVTERRLAIERMQVLLALGDRLHEATKPGEAATIAAEALNAIILAGRAGYADIDQKAGRFSVTANHVLPGVETFVGNYPLAAFPATVARLAADETVVVANVDTDAWLESDRPAYQSMATQAMILVPLVVRGQLVGILFAHEASPRTWTRQEVEFARGVADRAYATLARLRAEADQEVLNAELSHRLKNMFAMVQAITTQTLRPITDREPVEMLERRLQALSTAHDLLLQRNWTSASMGALIRGVIDRAAPIEPFDISGPEIALSAETTLTTTLVIHELTTNALKYGALAAPEGRIQVRWHVDRRDEEQMLTLEWRETGGAPTAQPTRRGFGTRLINRGLAGTGGVEASYDKEGFAVRFEVPLALVQRS